MDEDEDEERVEAFPSLLLPKAALLNFPRSSSATPIPIIGEASVTLKNGHSELPLWLTSMGKILLENFNPLAQTAHDFLVAIAEPVSRPAFIHEYKLTPYSLFAAVSVGLETMDIISGLDRLSKTTLPGQLISFIQSCTQSYGKVKIVLKEGRYWIESFHGDVLKVLLNDEIIASARDLSVNVGHLDKIGALKSLIEMEGLPEEAQMLSFPIKSGSVEQIKKRCIELDFPLLEEYDYTNDPNSQGILPITLKPSTQIRPYQEKALGKMFAHGRARSGIIVLPCGAGKTLVGITAACTIKRNVLVLCTSGVAVEQWKQQFKYFSTIEDSKIFRFTSDSKEMFQGPSGVIISTYSMIAYSGKRSYDARRAMEIIRKIEWGLVLLDEVHVVPANVFRRVISCVAAHTKLGLTATLVREDDKIEDLNFLIGPKLYEANWQDLADQGHIAQVQCAEVWCEMTAEFYREYLYEQSRKRRLIYAMNPNKFQACQYLIHYHEGRGDKIIVFSDDLYALKAYASKLRKPFICGSTPQAERMAILYQFQTSASTNTIFLSKVGDTSIDLPEATCLIQISSHFGSRRQEAQRLGRILRAKRRFDLGFSSFFYTLVSKDTEEMFYSNKRQQFLIDQGYSFKIITELEGLKALPNLGYATITEQMELLNMVLQAVESVTKENEEEDESLAMDDFERVSVVRSQGTLTSLSGAGDMAYMETNRPPSLLNKVKRQGRVKKTY